MRLAVVEADRVRLLTSPNPWVGCIVVRDGKVVGRGATAPPGGPHAEVEALAAAGPAARGATAYVTLEPCAHHGRTPPCADALVDAGVRRVVVGVTDPDPLVAGQGIDRLRAADVEVTVDVLADRITGQLRPYLVHRRTGRPLVVLKLAATLDGRIAAPDGTSTWITGPAARADVHRLRAESDAIVVGAGTVRADDPRLDVRDFTPSEVPDHPVDLDPRRFVLGRIPAGARVLPATTYEGDLGTLLDRLGAEGVLQVLVEGGADVAGRFHRAGLVDRYVVYLAPALMGGGDGVPLFGGQGAVTMDDVVRGRFVAVERLGADLRIDFEPHADA